MTVKELRELLASLPDDMPVMYCEHEFGYLEEPLVEVHTITSLVEKRFGFIAIPDPLYRFTPEREVLALSYVLPE